MDQLSNLGAIHTTYGNADADMLTAVGIGTLAAMVVTFIIIYVVEAIFMMQLFKKAKVARWKAWVPIVNVWTFLQIGGQKGWWVLAGVAGAVIGYVFFAIAGVTGVLGDPNNIGVDVAIGGFAMIGYLIMMAGVILMVVFEIIAAYNICKKLGWGGGMLVIYIFFQLIWLGIAGLGNTKWDDKKGQKNLAKQVG